MSYSTVVYIVSGCQSSKDYGDDDNDDEEEEKQLVKTEQEMMELEDDGNESNNCEIKGDLKRTRETGSGEIESSFQANADETEPSEVEKMHSTDKFRSNMTEFHNEVLKCKQKCYRAKLATKCHQFKIYRTKDADLEEVIRDFDNRETQPVLDKLKLIEDRWRTMDLWRIVKLTNHSSLIELDQEDLPQRNKTEHKADEVLRRSIILCCIFEDLSKKIGWKVGDTLDFEENICDVVGKLMLKVDECDKSSMLDCMQNAIMNIRINGEGSDSDKLISLLTRKKNYNGSNLACILLEQMILDNKDNNVSWMRIVCSQFIDLVVPLIIEPAYRNDIHWNLEYLLLHSLWSVADIYYLMRNGILLYHQRQIIFHRRLVRIQKFAVPPSLNVCLGDVDATLRLENILYCRDKSTLMCYDWELCNKDERKKSLDQVFNELKDDKVGQERESFIRLIIENSRTKLEKYNEGIKLEQTRLCDYRIDCKSGIEQELERIRNSKQKDGIDVLTSCLSLISMALIACREELSWYARDGYLFVNKQLVNYCSLVSSKMKDTDSSTNKEDELLEILAMETCFVVTAMVAATYALLGRTVDVVTHSRFKNFDKWRSFHTTLNLSASCNVDEISKGGIRLKQSILYCCDEDKWKCSENNAYAEEEEKTIDQVLKEMKENEVGQEEALTMKTLINNSLTQRDKYKDNFNNGIEQELERIQKSQPNDCIDVLSSCLSVVSMALYICKKYWPLNTQLVSYCLLVAQQKENKGCLTNEKGRLLEILTGEGKSCVIVMVAATYALLGRTVDIVTSSPVLSQRDAEEWREFYSVMKLEVGCNVEDHIYEFTCYECPIVYGTVETFARDILKTEFSNKDVRNGRKCDIIIVDEVDSMLIDQGVQCTYLSHDVASIGMRHFEPIFSLIWMNVSRLSKHQDEDGVVWYGTKPEVFLATLSRISKDIDPLQMLRLAEDDEVSGIRKGFTNEYLREDIEGQIRILKTLKASGLKLFFKFALTKFNFKFGIMHDLYESGTLRSHRIRIHDAKVDIIVCANGLSLVLSREDTMKGRLNKMMAKAISDQNDNKLDLPIHLREYCESRLRNWIDNAFLACDMKPSREYIAKDDAIYPVDYKSTGVIETNQKWGDGLQQFLEMKHGLPRSPLSLITNFLSNVDFFDRYGSNIVGVSGTLGNETDKHFMRDTFSVGFATIPTSKRRKLFELDGKILDDVNQWLDAVDSKVEAEVESQRTILVICEDIVTAHEIHQRLRSRNPRQSTRELVKVKLFTEKVDYDGGRITEALKPGDVVVTTNLGARGTDFVSDDVVNKNEGLFVLVTFIPLNDRVEKQAFGRTGRRGAPGSCQIIVNREAMPEWARQCETIDEVKRLRDSIEMHRLNNMTEVNLLRTKRKLFQEYCKFKKEFLASSEKNSEPDDIKIQLELLDETWAKWIQDIEPWSQESNHEHIYDDMMEELRRNIETCCNRAKQFESDSIYHIMKFGEVRLMKEDFEGASQFYDRVIRSDPEWSAFAHYNRAYCTLQIKRDGYIRRAIDDLNETKRELENYKKQSLFSEVQVKVFFSSEKYKASRKTAKNGTETGIGISSLYYTMMECQLFHHIDTQISETIENLETIDTMKGEVTTMRQDILDLIPGDDCRTEKMLQEYRQLGILFTFNTEQPKCFFMNQNVSSLVVLLESVAVTMLEAVSNGILGNADSIELKDMVDFKSFNDDSLTWILTCVLGAIMTGIQSIDFVRDVSSLDRIKQTEQESSSEMAAGSSEYEQFASSRATSISTLLTSAMQKMNKSEDVRISDITLAAMKVLTKHIQGKINERMAHGQKLHRTFCYFLNSVTSDPTRFDLEKFVNCVSHLGQLLVHSPQLSFIRTAELQNLVPVLIQLILKSSRYKTAKITSKIIAGEIEIENAITKFFDMLEKLIDSIHITSLDEIPCDDVKVLDAIKKVISSAWGDILSIVQSRIEQSVVFYVHVGTTRMIYLPIIETLTVAANINQKLKRGSTQKKPMPISLDASRQLTEMCKYLKETRDENLQVRSISENRPRHSGELIANKQYAGQLKRGRSLLRSYTNYPLKQINQCGYAAIDSSNLFSCIEQALKFEHVSQLANALNECESILRSADKFATYHEIYAMMSPVSRDACTLFLSNGSSMEAEVYRQLVVERINDGDITTALKLCYIGHQVPFCRNNTKINQPISDSQTLRDTFNQKLNMESYEQEMSKFLTICDEWYRFLEPRGLMNVEQRELLREWISARQYANAEDPTVSLLIEKCLISKRREMEAADEQKRKQKEDEIKAIRKEAMKQRRKENKMKKAMKDKEEEKDVMKMTRISEEEKEVEEEKDGEEGEEGDDESDSPLDLRTNNKIGEEKKEGGKRIDEELEACDVCSPLDLRINCDRFQ